MYGSLLGIMLRRVVNYTASQLRAATMSQHGVDRANAYLALPKVQIPTREAKALLKRGMSDLDAQVRAIAILSCETMRPIGIAKIGEFV
jgi:hypothetical protein